MNNKSVVVAASLDDMLFLNRNKNYGAYELRKNYDKRLAVALLAAVSFFIISLTAMNILPKPKINIGNIPIFKEDTSVVLLKIDPKKEEGKKILPPKGKPSLSVLVTKAKTDNRDTTDDKKELIGSRFGNDDNLGLGNFDLLGSSDFGLPEITVRPKVTLYDPEPDEDAMFPGGERAYQNYLQQNIKYPNFAIENGIEGTISMSLKIDEQGNVVDAKVEKSVGGGCDEEALRVVNSMPKWRPGKKNGQNIPVIRQIRVKMVLHN